MDKLKKVFLRKTLFAVVLLILSSNSASQLLNQTDTDDGFRAISPTDPYCSVGGYVETVLGLNQQNSLCQPITTLFNLDTTDSNDESYLPRNVSDWVLIELRAVRRGASVDEATTMTVISRKSALLLDTGHVVDAAQYRGTDNCRTFSATDTINCPLVEFSFADSAVSAVVNNRDLYVVVRHFNHLDIISAEAMETTTTVAMDAERQHHIYDFTTQPARGGPLASKKVEVMEGERNAMYLGDVNGDTNINAADYLEILSEFTGTTQASDIDFNDDVNEDDIASSKLQENLGRASQLP